MSTLASELAEPSDLLLDDSGEEPVLLVVESAAHAVVRVPVPAAAQRIAGPAHQVRRPPTEVLAGPLHLAVRFVPPTGQKLDDRYGDPTRLTVSASPPELLTSGAGSLAGLERDLLLSEGFEEGVLHVSVQAAACDAEGSEFAACHLYQQDWGIPVRLGSGATDRELVLHLRGV